MMPTPMKTRSFFALKRTWRCMLSVAAFAVAVSGIASGQFAGAAFAQDHSDGGHTGSGGSGGSGAHEDGEDGHEGGHSGGHQGGGSGEGEGPKAGEGGEGDGSGYRGGDRTGSGGLPVWAREGIPEVELGRLNVARSPDRVIDRAFKEALASFTPEVAAFYRLDLDGMIAELSGNWDNVRIIDSPLQNLALMRDGLDGQSILASVGITTDNQTLLAAFLGTASDKGIPVSTETAIAVSAILGERLDDAEAADLAAKAELIRQAIVEGHG